MSLELIGKGKRWHDSRLASLQTHGRNVCNCALVYDNFCPWQEEAQYQSTIDSHDSSS